MDSLTQADERRWMELALDEARKAGERNEVPVGAALVGPDGLLLAHDGNRNIELDDPSAHAEMLVLRAAGRLLANYRLTGSTLYVTLEPCVMCAGALVQARVTRVVFGATDPKGGGMVSRYRVGGDGLLNHGIAVQGGLMSEDSAALLRDFFAKRRQNGMLPPEGR